MNGRFKKLFADSLQLWSLVLSLLFFLGTAGTVGFLYKKLPPFLPLYNKMSWGYDRLGNTWEITIPFGVALVFAGSNFVLASFVQSKVPLLGRFLALTTVALSFFTCIFLLKIVFLVL